MDCYVYDTLRSPRGRGKINGSLHTVTSVNLFTQVIKAIVNRYPEASLDVEDVIAGCVMPVGEQGANIARVTALKAGLPQSCTGMQINRFCASGLDAIGIAAAKIQSNQIQAGLAGGVESMSRVPMSSDGGAMIVDPSVAFDLSIIPQGISADLISTLEGFSRESLDEYAVQSHQRAFHAQSQGWFKPSIIPIINHLGDVLLDHDETIRPECSIKTLKKLNPSFEMIGQLAGFNEVAIQKYPQLEKIIHHHHPGNSSAIVDGASIVLLGNKAFGDKHQLKPKAKIITMTSMGSEPSIMLTAPAKVAKKALNLAKMSSKDIDLWEVNEAFSSVILNFMREMEMEDDTTLNVNGGAIAMGHPLGATGAMIFGTVLDELHRRNQQTALISLCVAGGMGSAAIIERI